MSARSAAAVTVLLVAAGCSSGNAVSPPPRDASAVEVAHSFMRAYQAGDGALMTKLESQSLQEQRLQPGSLGHLADVRWLTQTIKTKQTAGPGFRPGEVDVSFHADTTGSPDGSIPAQTDWSWGFVLARRIADSAWIVVDQGTG